MKPSIAFSINLMQKYIKNTDIVIDATDNYRSRIIIDNASKKLGIPMIYGGCIGLKVIFQYLIIIKVLVMWIFSRFQMRKKMTVTQQGF